MAFGGEAFGGEPLLQLLVEAQAALFVPLGGEEEMEEVEEDEDDVEVPLFLQEGVGDERAASWRTGGPFFTRQGGVVHGSVVGAMVVLLMYH